MRNDRCTVLRQIPMFYFKSLVGKHGKYANDDFEKTIPSDYLLDCYRNSSAKSAGIRTNKDFDYK